MERAQILERMVSHLRQQSDVLACWEGGSTAFGADDAYSDIDLQVLVKDDGVEKLRHEIDLLLTIAPGIKLRFELPAPTWHGHYQVFYQLQDSSPFHMLDLLLVRESAPDRFLQPERHGQARILFDHGNYVRPTPLDQGVHQEKLQQRRAVLTTSFQLFHWLVDKEIVRGRPIDAMHFYQGMLARVVELARIRHCPDRYDFGGRYLQRDLPPELVVRIEQLYFVKDIEALRTQKRLLVEMFEELT